jgi:hypothetical protein
VATTTRTTRTASPAEQRHLIGRPAENHAPGGRSPR